MAEFQMRRTFTLVCPSTTCSDPSQIIRFGKRRGVQRYQCKTCRRRFSLTGAAKHKQVPAEHVGAAIDMYYSGMSYKQVAEHMEDVFDMPEPSKRSVHDWVKGYTKRARAFMAGEIGPDGTKTTATKKPVKAQTGRHWVADEMVLKVGGRKYWNWNVMDVGTRYVLASRITRGRRINDARAVFRKALRAASRPPDTITTDGLAAYAEAIKTVFPKARHVVSEGIYEFTNNNLSERLQGDFRQRTKTMRGLQTRRTAQDYLDGWVIDHNLFRDHHTLGGKTPGAVAGVEVPWDEWADVVRQGGEIAEPKWSNETIRRLKPRPPATKPRPRPSRDPRTPSPDPKLAHVIEGVVVYQQKQDAGPGEVWASIRPRAPERGRRGRGRAEPKW